MFWKLHGFSLGELFSRVPRARGGRAAGPGPLADACLSWLKSHNHDQTRNLYSCIQTLYINAIIIPHPFVITIMAQRVRLTKNISELVRHFILYIYFTIITHTFYYFYVYSLCNPNRFLYSILLIHVPTPIPRPADESMKDETPRTGILNFTHMTFSSRFIYFTCLHTSFLVQRDHTPRV
jgi:hypothetical protein